MVATLLRLRFRVLGNDLKRSPWQLVGFILGAIYGAVVLAAALVGLVALGFADVEIGRLVIAGAGSVVTLAWVVGPLLAFGIDTTLDPRKLVVFPIPRDRIMAALALAGVVGIPGILTSVAALGTIATWIRHPLAVVAVIVTVPLAVVTAVIASRVVAAYAAGLGGGRRARELSGVLILVPLILAGPIIAGVAFGLARNLDAFATMAQILSWTPLGAAWSVPGDVAAGAWLPAVAKLAIGLATLALVWFLWRGALEASVTQPAQTSSAPVKPGRIGVFARVPATRTGGVYARSLTYWLRDPRYQRQLLVVPLMPLLLWFYNLRNDAGEALTFSAPLIAFIIGIVLYADISYDGTAFATQLASGVSGRTDRIGRTLAAATIATPIVLLAAVLPFFATGRWSVFPAILGMGLGVLMSCYAVCAVTSAVLVVPVPASGDSPFKRVPGTTATQAFLFFGIWLVAFVLCAPTAVTGLIAVFTDNGALAWTSCALGLVIGAAALVIGVRVGGSLLDRNGPLLLTRLKAMKNA